MKNLKTFETFINEGILSPKGRKSITLLENVKDESDMIDFLQKDCPNHVYHPTLSGEIIVGMLIQKTDYTLDRRNEPMCVYWNTNDNELFLAAFPI